METDTLETNLDDGNPPVPKPWGVWSTLGFSILAAIAFVGCQVIVAAGFMVAAMLGNSEIDPIEFANSMETDGLFLWVATFVTTPICIALVVLFAALRKNITLRQYFSMNKIGLRQWVFCLAATLVFIILSDSITLLLGRPVVPEFMSEVYASSGSVIMLWIALIVCAPLFEETFFRGFLFKGLEYSKLGPIGAVVVTSLCWSVIHTQYDYYGIATIFALGLLFGFVRSRFDSLYPCFAMHALMNLVATIEVELSLHMN